MLLQGHLTPLLSVLKMAYYMNANLSNNVKKNVAPDNEPLAHQKANTISKKAVWMTADNAEMIRVLTKQQAARNQSDNGWKSLIWTIIAKALQGSEMQSGSAAKTIASCSSH